LPDDGDSHYREGSGLDSGNILHVGNSLLYNKDSPCAKKMKMLENGCITHPALLGFQGLLELWVHREPQVPGVPQD
jgi:hypothetical protein